MLGSDGGPGGRVERAGEAAENGNPRRVRRQLALLTDRSLSDFR